MEYLIGLCLSLFGSFICFMCGKIYSERKHLKLKYKLKKIREADVRFSIAYLFRIKINNNYLLIKGNNIKGQYQPVGGVYKYYASFKPLIDKWGIMSDENIPFNGENKEDLRVRVPKKNIINFLKWFESNQNREVCVFREFHEEVLKEIPDASHLFYNNFQAEFIRRDNGGLKFSEHYQCQEVLIRDIFEVKLSKEQEEVLRKLSEVNPKFRLCTSEEIKRKNFIENGVSHSIGGHTIKTLENGGQ